MTWIKLALALAKLASLIFDAVKSKALMQAGEDRYKLAQFQQMAQLSARLKEVEERYNKMPIEEIRKDIEAKGDFRD